MSLLMQSLRCARPCQSILFSKPGPHSVKSLQTAFRQSTRNGGWLSRAADPQEKEIPKNLFFLWMGRREAIPKSGTSKKPDSAGAFRYDIVAQNAKLNKAAKPTMWLDVFSMAHKDVLKMALSAPVWQKYDSWAAISQAEPRADEMLEDHEGSRKWLRDPNNFKAVSDMLIKARLEFLKWTNTKANNTALTSLGTLSGDMMNWCRENGIQVRWLDTDKYPIWIKKQEQLARWLFFELYFRNSNYGSASDLIRMQILCDDGGMYCDHDDALVDMHDSASVKQYQWTANDETYRGFRHNWAITNEDPRDSNKYEEAVNRMRPKRFDGSQTVADNDFVQATTGYMASPKNHPFVPYLRDQALGTYALLLAADNLKAKEYRHPGAPTKSWFDYSKSREGQPHSEFATHTINTTGPGMLTAAIDLASEKDNVCENIDNFRLKTFEWRVSPGFANTWLLDEDHPEPERIHLE